jgi:hypothetical protein
MGYCQLYKKSQKLLDQKEFCCSEQKPSFQVDEDKVKVQRAYVKKTKKIAREPIDYNKFCFECKALDPTFVSVTNGIVICGKCADIHK